MGNTSGSLDCDSAAGTPPASTSTARPPRAHHAGASLPLRIRVPLVVATCLLATVPGVRAWGDTLAKVRESGQLTYGSDKEGGGPYAYPDPKSPREVTGFEVELMNALASGL